MTARMQWTALALLGPLLWWASCVTSAEGEGEGEGEPPGDAGPDPVDAGPIDPPEAHCTSPVALYDTSAPRVVIGDGTASSCEETALRAAVAGGGVITFNCGTSPVSIPLTQALTPPVDQDTILDGGGLIILDGGGVTRHVLLSHPDWMNNTARLVLQRLRLVNGRAPAGDYTPQDPARPECAWGYKEGSGGAVYVRNIVLHVLDCEFSDNQAALIGPDVGGGAIYALGVPEVVISGTRFLRNRAANGGAVGFLWANPRIDNSVFEDNSAEGVGMNSVEPGCPNFNHDQQGGAGGNAGALYFDGMNDDGVTYTLCGNTFSGNRANELGGALFRTPNVSLRDMLIERSAFTGNTARMGGVSFIMQNDLVVRASTFADNQSGVNVAGENVGGPFGGLWVVNGSVDVENSTFSANQPSGLNLENGSGTLRNVTAVDSDLAGSLQLRNGLLVDSSCDRTFGGDHNLQWPSGSACAQGTTFADPALGELGDHGGPTPTVVPSSAGPAVGHGTDCPATDQRGESRSTASCAAGAVEP